MKVNTVMRLDAETSSGSLEVKSKGLTVFIPNGYGDGKFGIEIYAERVSDMESRGFYPVAGFEGSAVIENVHDEDRRYHAKVELNGHYIAYNNRGKDNHPIVALVKIK